MATKTSFSYYPVDTDRYSDIKIKRLKKSFGGNGVAVYDYLLCEIYRDKGCFLVWDECRAFDVADYFGLKESTVEEIVRTCCKCGLFDKAVFASGSVITSASIQRRYLEMCNRAKRKDMTIPTHINLLGDMQITEEKQKIPEKQPKITEELPKVPELFDKEKKSKVKERKENTNINVCIKEKTAVAEPKTENSTANDGETVKVILPQSKIAIKTKEERKKEFKLYLLDKKFGYAEKYGTDMLADFYNYWTESNPNGKKMRWEMQKVFDVSRRLATWAKNCKNKSNFNYNYENEQRKPFNESNLRAVVAAGFAMHEADSNKSR